MPHLRLEDEAGGIVCGIDEAGRGPLAGPVVAAAVVIDRAKLKRKLARAINDSKVLTREVRTDLYGQIRACARVGIGAASSAEIDRINILQATLLAMGRALAALRLSPDLALVDGNVAPKLPCPVKTVIGGDGISLSIAAASIVAKVTRDAAMTRLAQRYPGFGWETNVGYSTEAHFRGMDRLGLTPHHRRSFEPVVNILSRCEQTSPYLVEKSNNTLTPQDFS
jgi:ribonuclease HII